MIQEGGMFTHLGIPKVCSHIREVEFDSQHAPSNATSGRRKVGLVQSSDYFDSAESASAFR